VWQGMRGGYSEYRNIKLRATAIIRYHQHHL
jgi:hypothetical protein